MIEKDGFLAFELLLDIPNLFHGVFLRNGGVSLPPYASLNLGDQVGDDPHAVRENREIVRRKTGASALIVTRNVHGSSVLHFSGKDPCDLEGRDGLITQQVEAALLTTHAD